MYGVTVAVLFKLVSFYWLVNRSLKLKVNTKRHGCMGVTATLALNGISQRFQQFVRDNIVKFPVNKPRPVHLNTWEGIYFDHKPEYIMQMATEAAEMGVERFIIDDGWFIGRDGERAALGDWYLDEKKYPNG